MSEFSHYTDSNNDTNLLVSPLLVAGVVIGLVLFLSCVTIIIGSLRKDGRLRHPQLRRDASYSKAQPFRHSFCSLPKKGYSAVNGAMQTWVDLLASHTKGQSCAFGSPPWQRP